MIEPGDKPRIDRAMLAAKADEIDRTIERLGAMRDGLRHAAACRAPSHMECPTFRRILAAAGSGALGKPARGGLRSEAHTSELPSINRIPYAVFVLTKKTK